MPVDTVRSDPARALDPVSGAWLKTLAAIERTSGADRAVRSLQQGIRTLPLGGVREVLRGRQLGHPLHPVLVQLPVGCWLSAAVLDSVPGGQPAAAVLTTVGLAGAGPAAVAGWVDWAELPLPRARVGLAHAVANAAVIACYTVSLAARMRGHTLKGRGWSLAGLAALAVSGALGGHVAHGRIGEPSGT
ncbi:hypothetical protein OG730_38330 [Streptomyces sp. NBC_01298]|uniref:DUF2231 domain-containing protein n=1 Tax=Streptomyces sp. NBC_01298 TaxID=2903817 RepID=UPI002E0EB4BA|nr:hypothetical protein OG730_38330 [Streptomyces sp. NBC_01298]